MSAPLAGIKVIDLTRVLAGPFCTMILSDLGAEVIKIERTGSGDDSRAYGPYVNGESAYFMSINRGKKSLTLNLKAEKGKEILKKLVSSADILVENFKPGVMKKLSLDYEVLKQVNPRLIYCASSGFGQTGPYSSRPAYDLIIQGMSGLMSITGPDEEHPTKVGSSIADIMAGVFSVIGILAALNARSQTQRGQLVDIAMLDCMFAVLENAVARYESLGADPKPIGNRHPSISPFTTLKTSDGHINIACGNDALFKSLCDVFGLSKLAADARFLTNKDRSDNFNALFAELSAAAQNKTTADWLKKLSEAKIPAGPINKISQISNDPHIIARNMLAEFVHPKAGKIKMPFSPIKLSDTPVEKTLPPPMLGEHSNEILSSLGYSNSEIAALKAEAVI